MPEKRLQERKIVATNEPQQGEEFDSVMVSSADFAELERVMKSKGEGEKFKAVRGNAIYIKSAPQPGEKKPAPKKTAPAGGSKAAKK